MTVVAEEYREEICFSREMRAGRIPGGPVPARPACPAGGGGSGETLFCQDFDRLGQGVLAASCLGSIMT
ncbi:hypothetical protein GCM10022252_43850 [Streptosporangium oxazolinicum]|uniref:Uncharacterized protein n=1 Tax=Streptosporangium oxazolinicum TaxID=909287 RepID=A0ABP8B313_9ACTN